MPKNILYITSVASHWGSEKSLLLLVKHLDRNKFSPFVLTVSGFLQRELKKNNIKNLQKIGKTARDLILKSKYPKI